MEIILKNGTYFEPEPEFIEQLSKFYPRINIQDELRKIAAWNFANTERRKTRRGIKKHINTWLCKANDNAPVKAKPRVVSNVLQAGHAVLMQNGFESFERWIKDNQVSNYDRECILNAANGFKQKVKNLAQGCTKAV